MTRRLQGSALVATRRSCGVTPALDAALIATRGSRGVTALDAAGQAREAAR